MVWTSITGATERGQGERQGLLARLVKTLINLVPPRKHGVDSSAFMMAFVALAAKMAKADGVAVPAEAQAFEKFVSATCSETEAMRRLYRLASENTAGYELYAKRIGWILRNEPETRHAVLECLMFVACADGVLHHKEDEFLTVVAEAFHIPPNELRSMRCRFVRDYECPFEVLGLDGSATLAQVKARYRKLVNENHPDKLIAAGAPAAAQKAAAAKMAQFNTAYEQIEKELRPA